MRAGTADVVRTVLALFRVSHVDLRRVAETFTILVIRCAESP